MSCNFKINLKEIIFKTQIYRDIIIFRYLYFIFYSLFLFQFIIVDLNGNFSKIKTDCDT